MKRRTSGKESPRVGVRLWDGYQIEKGNKYCKILFLYHLGIKDEK